MLTRSVTRVSSSDRRRQDILDAALQCFSTLGYAKTTMEDIRTGANASTGSIYHHFKSKEQLAGALYLEGVREAQKATLDALGRHRSTERGIRAIVDCYLRWVDENPELAKFLFNTRHAEFAVAIRPAIARVHGELSEHLRTWMADRMQSGELPPISSDLFWSILIGPCELFARMWVTGRSPSDLETARRVLANAAWEALRGILPAHA